MPIGSIPASRVVSVTPNVLPAGGAGVTLSGIMLTSNSAVPMGAVTSFASSPDVANFFGSSSLQAALAAVYFAGFSTSTIKPGKLGFWQYNSTAVPAYLRGAAGLTLAKINAIAAGTLTINSDGVTETSSTITLTSDASPSAAAATIQAAFAAPSFTCTWDAIRGAFVFTTTATGATATMAFATSIDATASACTTTATALTVGGTITGVIQVGDTVNATDGVNTLAATIVSQTSGTIGGAGVYVISAAATPGNLGSSALTSTGPTGTLAKALLLTSATGAVLSQGAAIATPAGSMNALTAITGNFGSFMTDFDPDGGNGNTQKLAFATWNGLQNDSFVYACWDTDASPTTTVPATTSLGYLLAQSEISGTALIWEPSNLYYAAYLCGAIASVNFNQTNGRINFKFKGQSGLVPSVTSTTVATDLDTNGYNFYAEYAGGGSQWTFFGNGRISGPFNWIDSYIDEIWLDSLCQTSLMDLLTNINSIPFNPVGAAIIEGALVGTPATATSPPTGPISSALNFGMINTNVPLSSTQIVEVNTAAGIPIAGILQTVGWYLQVKVASPAVRATRGPWQINLWYMDGGSVNLLAVNSTALQ